MKMAWLQTFYIFIAILFALGCSDKSTINSFSEPDLFETVNRLFIDTSDENDAGFEAYAIREAEDATITLERLIAEPMSNFVRLNTSENREAEIDANGDSDSNVESSLPQFLVHTTASDPYTIWTYDLIIGFRSKTFDFQDSDLINDAEQICDIKGITRLDPDSFSTAITYSYDQFGVYVSAAQNCADSYLNRNFYELEFSRERESDNLIEVPDPADNSLIFSTERIIATRSSVPQALAFNNVIVTLEAELKYGILGYNFESQQLEFYEIGQEASAAPALQWTSPLARKTDSSGNELFPRFIPTSIEGNTPIIITYGADIYVLNKEAIFNLSEDAARDESLSSPIASSLYQESPSQIQYDDDSGILFARDGNFIMEVDTLDGSVSRKNIVDDLAIEDFLYTPKDDGFFILKAFDSGDESLVSLNSNGLEQTIEPRAQISKFFSDAKVYESTLQDESALRSVSSYDPANRTIDHAAVSGSFEVRRQFNGRSEGVIALVEGDETSANEEGLLKNSSLYIYKDNNLFSERTFVGKLPIDILDIDEVIIASDSYGLLYASRLVNGEEQAVTFYFNQVQASLNPEYTLQLIDI